MLYSRLNGAPSRFASNKPLLPESKGCVKLMGMSFPLWSILEKLDDSLRTVQSQVDGLGAALEVDDEQVSQTLMDAWHQVVRLRDLIFAERPEADWSDREALQKLIHELEIAAQARRDQQCRTRLLNLANELDAGRVQHRRESRSTALNALRLEAVKKLRTEAARPEHVKDLPGPKPSEWLRWACSLEDEKDALLLSTLRKDFDALEHFVGEMEEDYWVPAQPVQEIPKQALGPSVRMAEEPSLAAVATARNGPSQTVRARFEKAAPPAPVTTLPQATGHPSNNHSPQAARIRFINGSPTIRESGELLWSFVNEGNVNAKDVNMTFSVKYLSIPSGKPIADTTTHFSHRFAVIPPTLQPEARTPQFTDAIFKIPSREWQRFRDTDLVVGVKGTLKYDNGFNEPIEQQLCYYAFAWECWLPTDNKMELRPVLYRCDDGMTFEAALNSTLKEKCLQLEISSQTRK